MNIEQLMKRFNSMTKPETELMRQQRELGLLVIGEFKEDIDPIEAFTFCKVIYSCRERLMNGEEIPDDLTDELLKAKEEVKQTYNSKNIPTIKLDPA